MNTEPKSFKDISITGILLALFIFTAAMGIMAFVVYHMPTKIKLIGDLTISFLASVTFMLVMNSRNKTIRNHKDSTTQLSKNDKKYIKKIIVIWVTIFIFISIVKLITSR